MAVSGRGRAALALALLVPVPSLGAAMSLWIAPGPVGQAVYAAGKVWLAAFPAAWWGLVEGGRMSLSPPRRGGFGVGAWLGVAISAAIVGAFFAARGWLIAPAEIEAVRARAAEAGIGGAGSYLLFSAYLILVNSLIEEYAWRWFVFRQWEAWLSPRAAVAAAAVCFTLHHVVALKAYFDWPLTVLCSLGVLVGGVAWSWCYGRYRSIWPGYLSHAIVDVAVLAVGAWLILG